MNRLIEYTTDHPFLVAAAAILAVLAIVIEIRQRGRGSSAISPAEAVQLANGGALVVDVRDTKDFEAGHIIDARHVAPGDVAARAESFKKFKEKPVIVYCENGFASAGAARVLRNAGFGKVVTLRGGLSNWRQDNLPLVKGALKKEGKHA